MLKARWVGAWAQVIKEMAPRFEAAYDEPWRSVWEYFSKELVTEMKFHSDLEAVNKLWTHRSLWDKILSPIDVVNIERSLWSLCFSRLKDVLKVPAHKPLARCLVEMAADAIRERAQQRQVREGRQLRRK